MRQLLKTRNVAVLGLVAVATAAAGGAYAVASSGGTITVCVHHSGGALYKASKCKKHDKKLTWNVQGPQGLRGPTGAQGATGAQGSPGVQGNPGTPGTAQAYGLVDANGTLESSRSKNVASVTHPAVGVYCITVNGVSAQNEGAVVSPNEFNDTTAGSNIAHAEFRSDSGLCASSNQFEVDTYEDTVSAGVLVNSATAQGFFFVVP